MAASAGALVAFGKGTLESLRAAVYPTGGTVEATWGLAVLDRLIRDKNNVVIPILDCQLEGFRKNQDTSRVPYVWRSEPRGRILARVPVAGTYYPGFMFYDGPGDERMGIRIDGVECGVAIANADDNRDRLFFLSEPYHFQGGETIELRALTWEGQYHTEDLILLKEKPPAREFRYLFKDLVAQPEGSTAVLTWITNWPALCTVEWGEAGDSRLATATESLPLANHHVSVQGLEPGQGYRFRVKAKNRDNEVVVSRWQSFRAEQPARVTGTVKKSHVPLRIVNPAGVDLDRMFPVTSGVPFAKGVLGSDRHLRLLDAQGREVPLQTETLGRWPDGSVKWALLDFQAEGSKVGQYRLEYGSEVSRQNFPSSLEVTANEGEIRVATGPLRFTVDKRRFGLLSSLTVGDQAVISATDPSLLELTGADGTRYTSLQAPKEVEVEEAGPLRATVRVSGHYRAADGRRLFAYTVRLHAYAGQRFVRIEHTWGGDFGEAEEFTEFVSIRALRLRLPLVAAATSAGRRWVLGGGAGQPQSFTESQPVHLRQHTDDHFTIQEGEAAIRAEGKRSPGWGEWQDGVRRVTLAVRDFWQTYPKDLTVKEEGFELGICPPLRSDEYAAAKGTVDAYRLYYYLQGGFYRFRQGMSQTQDIWLEAAPESEVRSAVVQTQRQPLLAMTPAEWYTDSKALGELAGPGKAGLLAEYDHAFAHGFDAYMEDREFQRSYGMLNFGDWYGERMIDWGNSEYDTQHAFLMQFLRTGESSYFLAGEQMEWHNRDVDTIHFNRDASRVGGVYHHSIGHVGDYYVQSPVPKEGIVTGILTVDHVWVRGHLGYYFLTGDRRSLETARMIANRYDTYTTTNYDLVDCRIAGWQLILTMAIYEATHDRFHLNAGKIIVERALERQTADGGWDFYWQSCAQSYRPYRYGTIGYQIGILLTGMRAYYAVTGDEQVARAIVRGANCLVDQLWDPETRTFRFVSCPPQPGSPSPQLSFLLLDGIAFAHQRTRDPKLRQVLVEATDKAVRGLEEMTANSARADGNGVGKELGLYISNTPHFIGYVAKLEAVSGRTPAR